MRKKPPYWINYDVHALAVDVNTVAATLAADGEVRGFRINSFKVPRPGIPQWSYRKTESTSSALSSTHVRVSPGIMKLYCQCQGKKSIFFHCPRRTYLRSRGGGHWSEEKRQTDPKICWGTRIVEFNIRCLRGRAEQFLHHSDERFDMD